MKIILTLIFFSSVSLAQQFKFSDEKNKDVSSKKALSETQNILRDKKQREQLIKNDVQAKSADDHVNQVFGEGRLKEDIYDTSALVMKYLSDKNAGDPAKMQAETMKAISDPSAFMKSLPQDIQDKIRGLASEYETKKKKP